jgi:hypothetical protein
VRVRFCMLGNLVRVALTVSKIHAPLLNDVAENPHHAFCLLFCKTLIFEPLHELECVEMVVFALPSCRAEMAAGIQCSCLTGCELW